MVRRNQTICIKWETRIVINARYPYFLKKGHLWEMAEKIREVQFTMQYNGFSYIFDFSSKTLFF